MDAKQVWRAALGELQVSLSPANYETWLRDTQLVDVEEQRFRIAVPNGFAKDWLETRYRSLISQTLARIVGYSVQVEFVVGQRPTAPAEGDRRAPMGRWPRRTAAPAGDQHVRVEPTRVGGEGGTTNINPRYTFANFIVGSANRLAHAASLSVAERPGHAYNPLFLYGGVGLGKTHLMHAIGNQVIAKFPRKRVVYATSEKFTNEFITSIQQGKIDEFRARYRRIDLLLIDDIQFIADKERTQEEFFHTFNAIHEDGKQIVLSSDRPPKAILTLEERLRSRFEWGLIADLTAPDLETRIAILRAKAEEGALPDHLGRHRVHRAQGREQHPRARGRAQPDRRLREHGRHADQHRAGPGGPLERPVQPQEAPGHARAHRQGRVGLLQRPDGRPAGPEARQGDRHAPPDRDVPDARGDRRLAPAHRRRARRPRPLDRPPRLRQDHPRGRPSTTSCAARSPPSASSSTPTERRAGRCGDRRVGRADPSRGPLRVDNRAESGGKAMPVVDIRDRGRVDEPGVQTTGVVDGARRLVHRPSPAASPPIGAAVHRRAPVVHRRRRAAPRTAVHALHTMMTVMTE